MLLRLQEEDKLKSKRIKQFMGDTTHVTSFFPKKVHYPGGSAAGGANKPTLFIPFGKHLGTQNNGMIPEHFNNIEYPKATLAGALLSIPSQLVYDVFLTIGYSLLFVPSLFAAIGFGIHANLYNNMDSKIYAEVMLGNMVCAPYFALAIVIDLARELLALATRSYATLTESSEGKACDYWVADDHQFSLKK